MTTREYLAIRAHLAAQLGWSDTNVEYECLLSIYNAVGFYYWHLIGGGEGGL